MFHLPFPAVGAGHTPPRFIEPTSSMKRGEPVATLVSSGTVTVETDESVEGHAVSRVEDRSGRDGAAREPDVAPEVRQSPTRGRRTPGRNGRHSAR